MGKYPIMAGKRPNPTNKWLALQLIAVVALIQYRTEWRVNCMSAASPSTEDVDLYHREASNSSASRRGERSADLYKQMDYIYEQYELTGPRCIPQTSVNKRFNPYHKSLVSLEGAQVRRGYGQPSQLINQGPVQCTLKTPCRLTLEKSITESITDTISISSSNSRTQSVSLGRTRTDSQSDTIAQSITQGVEDSINNVDTTSSDTGISETVSEGLSKNQQRGTSRSSSANMESSKNTNWNQEVQGGVGINIGIFSANVGGSGSRGGGTSNSFGFSNSEEENRMDAVGMSSEAVRGKTSQTGSSNSKSKGRTNTYSASDTKTKSTESSDQTSQTNEQSSTKQDEFSRSKALLRSVSTSLKFEGDIQPGTCKRPVCKPITRSMVVPYLCVSPTTGQPKELISEINMIELSRTTNLSCIITLIDCKESLDRFKFQVDDDEFYLADSRNSLEFGRYLQANRKLSSTNDKFQLSLLPTGELRLTQNQDTEIWSNGIKSDHFRAYKKRARLTELGHLLVEVSIEEYPDDESAEVYKNSSCKAGSIFSQADKFYKCLEDDWTVIWSSAAIQNQDIQIGVARQAGEQVGYKLVVSDRGELQLFDAYAVMIWCSSNECQHRHGYRYPRLYLLPTNKITERVEDDKHNMLQDGLAIRSVPAAAGNSSTLTSCHELEVGEALQSDNGRFHAYLMDRGGLVVKDGQRTMWDSMSSNSDFTRGPYSLRLQSNGQAVIRDKDLGNLIWHSQEPPKDLTKPFKMRLQDSGELAIYDKLDRQVWSAWPTADRTLHYRALRPFLEPRDEFCDGPGVGNQSAKYLFVRDASQCFEHSGSNKVQLSGNCGQRNNGDSSKLWLFDARTRTLRPKARADLCLSHSLDCEWLGLATCNQATSLRAKDHWLADGSKTFKLCIDNVCWRDTKGSTQDTNVDWRDVNENDLEPTTKYLLDRESQRCYYIDPIKPSDNGRDVFVHLDDCDSTDGRLLWSFDRQTQVLKPKMWPDECLIMHEALNLWAGSCSASSVCKYTEGEIRCPRADSNMQRFSNIDLVSGSDLPKPGPIAKYLVKRNSKQCYYMDPDPPADQQINTDAFVHLGNCDKTDRTQLWTFDQRTRLLIPKMRPYACLIMHDALNLWVGSCSAPSVCKYLKGKIHCTRGDSQVMYFDEIDLIRPKDLQEAPKELQEAPKTATSCNVCGHVHHDGGHSEQWSVSRKQEGNKITETRTRTVNGRTETETKVTYISS